MFVALALIPVDKINEALEIIQKDTPSNCDSIYNYFIRQWVNKVKPEIWNHFEYNNHRTNNRAEGYHSKINKLISNHNPNIFHIINLLKSIELNAMIQLRRVDKDSSQVSTERNKRNEKKDLIISLIKEEYPFVPF